MVVRTLYVRESNLFVNFEPVQKFQSRRDVTGFSDFDSNTSKRILDELEAACLRIREIEVE